MLFIHFCFIVVNKIKQNRDVTINIPDETHGSAIIRIEGNKHGVEEAKAVSFFMKKYKLLYVVMIY